MQASAWYLPLGFLSEPRMCRVVAHSCQGWVPTKAKAMPFVMSCEAVKPAQDQRAPEERESMSANDFVPTVTVLSSPARSPLRSV